MRNRVRPDEEAFDNQTMIFPRNSLILTETSYTEGLAHLAAYDADLAGIIMKWGKPPFWTHPPGFQGMVLAILSQQVSLESAQATFSKLEKLLVTVHPENLLALDEKTLRAAGFSRQKASYVRGLASGMIEGEISLKELELMEDDQAMKEMVKVRGIGPWTAATYLLFSLRRSDVWPSGDLALAKAIQDLRRLSTRPGRDEIEMISEKWSPWRAVAARVLWHYYLCERGRRET